MYLVLQPSGDLTTYQFCFRYVGPLTDIQDILKDLLETFLRIIVIYGGGCSSLSDFFESVLPYYTARSYLHWNTNNWSLFGQVPEGKTIFIKDFYNLLWGYPVEYFEVFIAPTPEELRLSDKIMESLNQLSHDLLIQSDQIF